MLTGFDDVFVGLRGRQLELKAPDALFRIGDPIHMMYVIRSGVVHLLRDQISGAHLILQRALPGSVLAEASLYMDRYHCSAHTVQDALVWAIPRRALIKKLATDSAFAEAWATHLAREVQRTRLQCEILSMKTVAARLDAWVGWHGAMPLKGQWSTLAAEIGVSREALYREIARRRPTA